MKGSKLSIVMAMVLALLVMLFVLLAGCEVSFKVSTASISEATMCNALDKENKPLNTTDTFVFNTPQFYCSYKLSNASPDTEITGQLIYVQGEFDKKNYNMGETSIKGSGTTYGYFSFTPPTGTNNIWPKGDYSVKIFIDGKEKVAVPFKVGDIRAPGASASGAFLSEPTICTSVDSRTMLPIDKADVFTTDTPAIYCSVKLSNAPPKTEVKVQWVYLGTNQVISESSGPEEGLKYLAFFLKPPNSGWPVGSYSVKLFLNGQEKFNVPFKVQFPTSGAFLSEPTICKSRDPNTFQPIEKADVFAPNTPVIYCTVKVSNAPAKTPVKTALIYVQGELDKKNYNMGEATIVTDGTQYQYVSFYFNPPSNGWPRGDYGVKLFLNGQEKYTVSFKVQ